MKNEQPQSIFKRVMSAFSIIGYILLICVVGLLCYFIINSKINNKVPVFGGYSFLKVISPSMEPTISVGEYILIKKIDINNIKSNDVISFYHDLTEAEKKSWGIDRDKIVITHRVDEVLKDNETNIIGFKTKGDANNGKVDSWTVLPDQVVGIYDTSKPALVKIINFIGNPLGIITLVIFPLSMILVSDIVNLIKVINEKDDDNYYDDEDDITDDDDDEFGNFDYGNDERFDDYDYPSKYIDYYNDDD